jgi:hypothetical protein
MEIFDGTEAVAGSCGRASTGGSGSSVSVGSAIGAGSKVDVEEGEGGGIWVCVADCTGMEGMFRLCVGNIGTTGDWAGKIMKASTRITNAARTTDNRRFRLLIVFPFIRPRFKNFYYLSIRIPKDKIISLFITHNS